MRVVLIVLLALGCAKAKEVGKEAIWQLNPFGTDQVFVDFVGALGPYLYVALRSERTKLNFLVPSTVVCARVFEPEAEVTYLKRGVFGRFARGEESCDPSGVASLAAWRDRKPRARGKALPRAMARFQVIYHDDEAVLARGRFPLASRVQIPGGYELVALFPNTPACHGPLEAGEASMVFRDVGADPFRLMVAEGDCPILGFAMPPAPESSQ
jgi:hypothetical protein